MLDRKAINSFLVKTMVPWVPRWRKSMLKERGIFQDKFGFGASPALVLIDMAYGWTDPRRECEGLREGVTLAQCAHADGKPD